MVGLVIEGVKTKTHPAEGGERDPRPLQHRRHCRHLFHLMAPTRDEAAAAMERALGRQAGPVAGRAAYRTSACEQISSIASVALGSSPHTSSAS